MGDIVRMERGGRFIGWYVRFVDADGRRRQRASHQPTHAQARRFLLAIEARVARGLVGIPEPAPPCPTVAELVERFLTEYSRPKIKDPDAYRTMARCALRRALPVIGKLRADCVQAQDLDRLRNALARTHAPASARLTLAFLSRVYNWGAKHKLVETNPVRGIDRPAAVGAVEYLSRDEVRALLAHAQQRAEQGTPADRCRFACVHLALHAGLRRGELLGLRLQDVDLTTRRLTVARSFSSLPKSGKPRHIRLPELALPVLSTWLTEVPRSLGLVFPVLDGPRPRMGSRRELLGLPELLAEAGCRAMPHPWHVLRHSFASHFVMSGGNLLALQKILGHSSVTQTMVYAHLAPDFLATEIDKLRY